MARIQVTARLPAEMVGMIDGLALLEDRTFSQTVERLLKAALAEREVEVAGRSGLTPVPSRSASAEVSAGVNGNRTRRKTAEVAPARSRTPATGEPRPKFKPDFKGGKK